MTKSEQQKALRSNSLLWLMAMLLPGALHLAVGSTRFPWPAILPFLLFGAMLASNRMLANAMGKLAEDTATKPETGT